MREIGDPYGTTIGEICGAYAMLEEVSQTYRDPSKAMCRTCGMLATSLGSVVTTEIADLPHASTGQVGMVPLATCELRRIGKIFEENGQQLTGEIQASLTSAILSYRRLRKGTAT
jgi:hypothetical protein